MTTVWAVKTQLEEISLFPQTTTALLWGIEQRTKTKTQGTQANATFLRDWALHNVLFCSPAGVCKQAVPPSPPDFPWSIVHESQHWLLLGNTRLDEERKKQEEEVGRSKGPGGEKGIQLHVLTLCALTGNEYA